MTTRNEVISEIWTEADLVKIIGDELRKEQFKGRAKNWRREFAETVVLVHLQKSTWGSPRYQLHLCVCPKAFAPPANLSESFYPLGINIRRLMDYWKSRTLLELDDPRVTPKERADGIRSMITDHVMPMFRQCDTNTGLREFLIANREIYNWASAMLKSFLDLPDPHWLKEYANEPKPPPFSHQYAELFNNILHQRRK